MQWLRVLQTIRLVGIIKIIVITNITIILNLQFLLLLKWILSKRLLFKWLNRVHIFYKSKENFIWLIDYLEREFYRKDHEGSNNKIHKYDVGEGWFSFSYLATGNLIRIRKSWRYFGFLTLRILNNEELKCSKLRNSICVIKVAYWHNRIAENFLICR